ncbi:hypothetical protein OIO90_006459 [Microbotryomycetes sp. JL221]|nr:hypothetical protein OIO90_006459 [Microbotryomycetes sp. JL221]
MAGLTTASLVSLDEPTPLYDNDQVLQPRQTRQRWHEWFGLSSTTTKLDAIAFLSTALLSISFLVFLNSSQPFVLDQLGVHKHERGSVTGKLILADEIVALVGYLVWGYVADNFVGIGIVAGVGNVIVGFALVLFVSVKSVWPGLLIARILFATGASALVTTLSAALSAMTALPQSQSPSPVSSSAIIEESEDEQDASNGTERDVLLSNSLSDGQTNQNSTSANSDRLNSGRFSGLLGFSTGCGALIGVLVFLPLPTRLANWFPLNSDEASLARAIRWTFLMVALIAMLEAIFVSIGLRVESDIVKKRHHRSEAQIIRDRELQSSSVRGHTIKQAVKDIGRGFSLTMTDSRVTLAYVASFASRATSSIATGFIPLLVNHYFTTHDLCTPSVLFESSPSREACRPAFIRASILTGVLQLTSLLLAPFIGLISSRLNESIVLCSSSILGAISFITFATLPNQGDPRSSISWPSVIGMGASQIGGIVTSLSLVANVRGDLVVRDQIEVGGRLSAAYSFCGGIGILLIGNIGGTLFDIWVGAPFLLVGLAHVVVILVSAYVLLRQNRQRRPHESSDMRPKWSRRRSKGKGRATGRIALPDDDEAHDN